MLELLAVFIGGYLLGSIPTAFFVVKRKAQVDVRQEGSGKAGSFNAFFVTGSKVVGILVGVLDALKGFASVYVAGLVFPGEFAIQAIALFGAIAGHNYPVWLRFKGGRGLSTAAGGLFLLGFSYAVIWCVLWMAGRFFRRDILTSNLIAIFITPVLLQILPWDWVNALIAVRVDGGTFLFFSCVLSMQLLLGHSDAVTTVWKQSKAEKT